MDYQFRSLRILAEWEQRTSIFLAVIVGPALVVAQIAGYLDEAMNLRITSTFSWFVFVIPFLVGIGVVTQLPLCCQMAARTWQGRHCARSAYWLLMALPLAIFVFIANLTFSYRTEPHMSYDASLAAVHMTRNIVDASVGLLGFWTSLVGQQLRKTLKKHCADG